MTVDAILVAGEAPGRRRRLLAGASVPGGAPNWGTGEIETMTSSTANVFQDGQGHLLIRPIRDGAGNWTSGRIETQRTDFAAPAGGKLRFEASLQQPAAPSRPPPATPHSPAPDLGRLPCNEHLIGGGC